MIAYVLGVAIMAFVSVPVCMLSVRWAWKSGWTVRKILVVFTPASVVLGGVLGYTMACIALKMTGFC